MKKQGGKEKWEKRRLLRLYESMKKSALTAMPVSQAVLLNTAWTVQGKSSR
jgi:hypothetical protein